MTKKRAMRVNHCAMVCAGAAMLLAMLLPNVAQAGDVAKAKRDLTTAQDNAETGRWDDFVANMNKATADMAGLPDAELTPLQGQLAEVKATVTKSVEEDITRRLERAATATEAGQAKLDIDRAM